MAQYNKKNLARDPSYEAAGKNLPAKKFKHTSPTEVRLSFEFTGGTTQFIDLASALSAVNRKFVSQQAYFYVNKVELYNNEDAFVDLHVVPDTWVTKNAYNRARNIFNLMNDKAMGPITGSIVPKYHDFKVLMNDRHRTTGATVPTLYDINSVPTPVVQDEWQYSQLVSDDDDGDAIQDADEFYMHMLGPHVGSSANWTSVGLVKSFGESRVTVRSSAPDSGQIDLADPLMNIFDSSSEESINDIVENLMGHNDQPPYDYDGYNGEGPGSMAQCARLVTTATFGRIASAPGFCAPFGLICVDPQNTATSYRLVLTLAPGTYHGVYAERV
jgi:hypothetical protein